MRPRVLGVLDRAGFATVLRGRRSWCGLPLFSTASAPWRWRGFRGSIARPARSPVNASPPSLRARGAWLGVDVVR